MRPPWVPRSHPSCARSGALSARMRRVGRRNSNPVSRPDAAEGGTRARSRRLWSCEHVRVPWIKARRRTSNPELPDQPEGTSDSTRRVTEGRRYPHVIRAAPVQKPAGGVQLGVALRDGQHADIWQALQPHHPGVVGVHGGVPLHAGHVEAREPAALRPCPHQLLTHIERRLRPCPAVSSVPQKHANDMPSVSG